MQKAKILLVEDDAFLGASISESLQIEGHQVDWVKDGNLGLDAAKTGLHDLMLLDIMLPHKNGLEVLKELRKTSNIPTIFLTARTTQEDKVEGLKLQADDYITKPFHLEELLLRIQNLLRRQSKSETIASAFSLNHCDIDLQAHTIRTVDGKIEVLSEKEVRLLRLLFTNKNNVVTREDILNLVWGYEQGSNTRSIDNMILKFRKWIEINPSEPKYILSIRGVGYLLHWEEK
ncbi:MAG: response regulator transcription factor [Bdellovibrionales bacterium]|nr:response regulator transcription factor [Bdellovibrionales bacterium]